MCRLSEEHNSSKNNNGNYYDVESTNLPNFLLDQCYVVITISQSEVYAEFVEGDAKMLFYKFHQTVAMKIFFVLETNIFRAIFGDFNATVASAITRNDSLRFPEENRRRSAHRPPS